MGVYIVFVLAERSFSSTLFQYSCLLYIALLHCLLIATLFYLLHWILLDHMMNHCSGIRREVVYTKKIGFEYKTFYSYHP